MHKFLSIGSLQGLVKRVRDAFEPCARFYLDFSRDPLAHPVLDVMDLRELADLPARELRARLPR